MRWVCALETPVSPKFHDHEVGTLVDVSVNATASGNWPCETFEVKLATGGARATTDM